MLDYLKTDQEQRDYSKKKLPELHERYNYLLGKLNKVAVKIERHESIINSQVGN